VLLESCEIILETLKLMQLQIERTSSLPTQQSCVLCDQFFKPNLARVIVCSRDGEAYGDLCTDCLAQGSGYIRTQLQQILVAQAEKNTLQTREQLAVGL
jgi:hypothetical protein